MEELEDHIPPSFTQLEFTSEGGNISSSSLHDPVSEIKNLYEDVEDEVERFRGNQNPDRMNVGVDEPVLPRDLRQDVLSLYALSSAVIEAFAAELVMRELVVDEHRNLENVKDVFERATGVSENLRLLFDMDVIDNGLHGELQSVVRRRNDYIHEPDTTLYIEDYDEFLSEAKRCKRATKDLAVVLDGDDYRDW